MTCHCLNNVFVTASAATYSALARINGRICDDFGFELLQRDFGEERGRCFVVKSSQGYLKAQLLSREDVLRMSASDLHCEGREVTRSEDSLGLLLESGWALVFWEEMLGLHLCLIRETGDTAVYKCLGWSRYLVSYEWGVVSYRLLAGNYAKGSVSNTTHAVL